MYTPNHRNDSERNSLWDSCLTNNIENLNYNKKLNNLFLILYTFSIDNYCY